MALEQKMLCILDFLYIDHEKIIRYNILFEFN